MDFEPDQRQDPIARQPAFFFFALLLLVQLTLAAAVQLANVAFGLIFSEVFFFAVPVLLWSLGANLRPSSFLKLRWPGAGLIGLGALVGGANFLLSGSLQFLTGLLMPESLTRQFDSARLFEGLGGVELGLLVAALGIFAPLGEEIAFRGYLQTVLSARLRNAGGIAITAVLFALLHFDPVGFASRVELGVLFGVLVLWSGSFWPAVAAHAANNLIAAAALLGSLREAAPAEPAAPEPLQVLLAGLGALIVTALLLGHFRARARATSRPDLPLAIDPGLGHEFEGHRARRAARISLAVALVSLGLFLAIDWRGAALNYIDLAFPSAQLEKRVPDEERREQLRDRLSQVRRSARGGEFELDRYRELMRALWGDSKAPSPLTPDREEEAFAPFEPAQPAGPPLS